MKPCKLFAMNRGVGCRARWLLFAAVALLTFGCRSSGVAPDGGTLGRTALGNPVISSSEFGEKNHKDDYNASGVVPLGDSRFLFCDNNTGNALYELDLTPEGQKQGALIKRPLQGLLLDAVEDLEGMTLAEENGRRFIFVTSSCYVKREEKEKKGKLAKIPPSGLLRVTINADGSLQAENMPGFRDWLIQHEPELAAAATLEPDDGGLNIEGLAWDHQRHALLFGVRTPVPQGKPLIVPVKLKDLAGPWTIENLEMLPPIRLTLTAAEGEQGIRSIEFSESRHAFLVVVGKSISDSDAPFALYEWDGQSDGTLKRLKAAFARKMKPEGVTGGTVGGKPVLLFVDDAGGYQVVQPDLLHP